MGTASSADPIYDGFDPADVCVTNMDDDGQTQVFTSTDTPLDIRDAHPKNGRARTTTFTLEIVNTSITSIGTLDLDISIDGGGTGFTDLSAVLISPLGTTQTIATLTSGIYQTSVFGGEPLAGIWKLEIIDSVNKSPHELTSWSLVATAQPAGASASETASAADAALLAWVDFDSSDDDDTDVLTETLGDDLASMLVA